MSGPRFEGAAPVALEGVEAAERYLAPAPRTCTAFEAPILSAPGAGAEQVDQLLHGETFAVLGERDGYAFGEAGRDGYAGWVRAEALGADAGAPDRRVTALRSYVFSRPHLKSAPAGLLSLNALVVAGEARDGFLAAAGGWVWAAHTAPVGAGFAHDVASVAERFLGAPYRWGGRDSLGLDCSGLVQQAFYACGRGCPRDTGDQRRLGRALARDQAGRGDLVFWPGHVGLMLDGERLIHANAHHMAVAIEPLEEADVRIAAACGAGGEVRRA